MKRICLIFASVALALVSVLIAACGTAAPTTDSSATDQLTNSQWSDQPPAVNGGHVVWARRNPSRTDTEGRGIFVATAE